MNDVADVYVRLRTETIAQLGFDAAKISPSQEAKLAMICGLKLEADRLAVAQLKGLPVDPKAILVVGEALEAALRPIDPQQVKDRGEARERLKALIDATILAGPPQDQPTRAELEAEVAELRERLALAGAVSAAPAAPSAENVVPLHKATATATAPAPTQQQPPAPSKFQDTDSAGQAAYAAKLEQQMTRRGTEEWRSSYATNFGIHSIPKGF